MNNKVNQNKSGKYPWVVPAAVYLLYAGVFTISEGFTLLDNLFSRRNRSFI